MTWVSSKPAFAFPLLLALLVYSLRTLGRAAGWKFWLALVLSVGVGDGLGAQLKDWFAQYRPCFEAFWVLRYSGCEMPQCGASLTGMPSNHAINFFTAATFVALTTRWRAWQAGLWLAAILVALSRIYLGKHYPSQVLAGAFIGSLVGFAGAWLACRWQCAPVAQLNRLPSGITLAENAKMQLLRYWQSVTPALVALRNRLSAFLDSEESTQPTEFTMKQISSEASLSVVIPLYNEQENVLPLLEKVQAALSDYPAPWEVILVDDGSSDGTDRRLHEIAPQFGAHVRVLSLQRNFGQTAAMQAGIDAARGAVIATLDGDLQNDPVDIPRMVKRLLDEELDLLVGWRKDRKDSLWLRKVPSRLANRLIGRITQVQLHDYGCSLKVYRSSVIKKVRLFGEMHRFIPAWVAVQTSPSRIKEEVVNHHARQFGASKYGIGRTFRVLVDLLAVYFFMRFLSRPGHFFGRIGLIFGAIGSLMLTYLAVLKFIFAEDIGTRPMLLTGILLILMAIQFLTTGVLGELMARTYFSTGAHCPYIVRTDSGEHQAQDQGWSVKV